MSLRGALVVIVGLGLVTPTRDASALDQDSLRLRKDPSGVELSWTDPDPTVCCVMRDPSGPVTTLIGQSLTLSYLDVAPPSAPLLYYQVDEPITGSCVPLPPSCTPAGLLACGTVVAAANTDAGSTDRVDAYACGAADTTGPEIAYTFTAAASERVTATLSGLLADLDLFVIEDSGAGCDPAGCIAGGADSIAWDVVAGATYHVVVDGRLGATSTFTLSLTCLPSTCSPVGSLACGGSVAGDTSGPGSSSVLVDHAGCSSPGYAGPEQLHEFIATADDAVTVALANAPAALDVFVLRDEGAGCAAATCIASGDTVASFAAVAGQRYWFAVDAPAGITGTYDLGVACAAAECQPDMTLLCGQAIAHNNAWPIFSDVNDAYPCTPLDLSGPEYTFTFTATQSGRATATLSNLSAELDVLVLVGAFGCSAASCNAWGDDAVGFDIVGGETYHVVVDGRAGAEGFFRLDLSCVVPPSTCDPHGVIRCSDLVGNDTVAGRDRIDAWPCSPGLDTSGPEYDFQFAPDEDATVRVVMDLNTEDLDLFVVLDSGSGCEPAGCVATGDSEVTFAATAGRVYYVVVDGRSGVSDVFRLWMDCQRLPGRCRPSGPVACGAVVSGRNDAAGSTDAIDQYPTCLPYPEEGPEYSYEFMASATGTLRVALSNLTADLDVFVLHDVGSGCVEPSCVAAGNQSVDVPVVAGERYYIVVEGFAGNVGAYDLSVTCL